MRKFLKKRWHSIPVGILAAVMALVLVAGGAFAAYQVWTSTATVDVQEPVVVYTAADVEAGDVCCPEWGGWLSLKELPETLDPGEGACAKYLIHNEGNAPLDITVTTNSPAGTSECGLHMLWANSSADMLRGDCDPIVENSPAGPHYLTHTFTIGTYDYLGGGDVGGISGGELYDAEKGDSSYVKLYVGFLVNGDAEPGAFDLTITVERDTAS